VYLLKCCLKSASDSRQASPSLSTSAAAMADTGQQELHPPPRLPPHAVGAFMRSLGVRCMVVCKPWHVRSSPSTSDGGRGTAVVSSAAVSVSPCRWRLHATAEIRNPCVAHRAQSTLCRPPTSEPCCGKRSTVNFTNHATARKGPSGPTQLEESNSMSSLFGPSARHFVSFLLRKSLDILLNLKLGKPKQNNLKLAI